MDLPNLLAERAETLGDSVKDNLAVAVGLMGALIFSAVRLFDDLFYNVSAGIAPEEVGRDYVTSLAAVVAYGSAFVVVVWLPLSQVKRGRVWAGVAVMIGLATMVAFAAWELQVAVGGPCGSNDGLLRSSTNVDHIIAIPAGTMLVHPGGPRVTGKLLGTGESYSVIIDCSSQAEIVYRLPNGEYLIATYEE